MSRTGTPQAYPAFIRAPVFLLLVLIVFLWWTLDDGRTARQTRRLTVPAAAPTRTKQDAAEPKIEDSEPKLAAPEVTGVRGRIRPVPRSGRFRIWWGPYQTEVKVAADGSFRTDKPAAGELDFFFDHAAPISRKVADRDADLGLIELDEGLTVRGTLLDDLDAPIAGATVGLHVHGWREAEDRFVETDALGRFEFRHLPGGVYNIWFRAEGFANKDYYDLPLRKDRRPLVRLTPDDTR